MIFVEPVSAYSQRARQRDSQKGSKAYLPPQQDGFWIEVIFDTLRDYGDVPMRFTTLINMVAQLAHYTLRDDRESRKIELLKLVGRLVRLGKLDRVDRKFVAIPKSDARLKALLAAVPSVADLPPPEL